MKKIIIPSVNLHLTKACNMKCAYCFAGFCNVKRQSKTEETIRLLHMLSEFGFRKVNFVGGEPLLISDIDFLLSTSKKLGFYTSLVTNGVLISEDFLNRSSQYIDQIGVSIDSLNAETNRNIGRICKGKGVCELQYSKILSRINEINIDLKINTVVSRANHSEDMSRFINNYRVQRWKVFQVLHIENENSHNFKKFEISKNDFLTFCKRQRKGLIRPDILTDEENDIMRGSYIMINPDGCFFDNNNGGYSVSEKIVGKGVLAALEQIFYDYEKFLYRKGDYFINDLKVAI